MTDTITLPRAHAQRLHELLKTYEHPDFWDDADYAAAVILDAALAQPVHPGYIIGSHWLETAYSRIAAGEVEADVLAEVLGARGWAKREPATDGQIFDAYQSVPEDNFYLGWDAAERHHGITKEDKT